jgi:hypothetical protein
MGTSWETYIAREEEQAERACNECAAENGYTPEQAEECDDGNLECKGCPWGKKNEKNMD